MSILSQSFDHSAAEKLSWLWNEGVCFARATSSCCPTNSVNVVFAVCWNVEIHNYVNMRNIETPDRKQSSTLAIKSINT